MRDEDVLLAYSASRRAPDFKAADETQHQIAGMHEPMDNIS
jgi:hypothetical protein